MSTDFSSIDRLVEFGMGISLAQQMVNTMNHVMSNTGVAGVNAGTTGQPLTMPGVAQWYVVIDGAQAGPLTDAELTSLVKNGRLERSTLVWRQSMDAWQMAVDVPEVNKLFLLYQK